MRFDICIPTKDRNKLNLDKMNVDIIEYNKIHTSEVKGLANARNELMSKVETEWFLFIDDDIEINKKWWGIISEYTKNPKVGAVSGLGCPNSFILKIIRKTLLKIRGNKLQRGFTSNTLIRKKAVEGIILKREGRLEDMELQEKVRANGYLWILDSKAECRHLKSSRTVLKEAFGDFKTLVRENGLKGALLKI